MWLASLGAWASRLHVAAPPKTKQGTGPNGVAARTSDAAERESDECSANMKSERAAWSHGSGLSRSTCHAAIFAVKGRRERMSGNFDALRTDTSPASLQATRGTTSKQGPYQVVNVQASKRGRRNSPQLFATPTSDETMLGCHRALPRLGAGRSVRGTPTCRQTATRRARLPRSGA